MDVVGLVSGGKDSIFNLLECHRRGHRVLCLANLYPIQSRDATATDAGASQELDSFMIQTVAYTALPALAECMGLPLVRRQTAGQSRHRGVEYPVDAARAPPSSDAEIDEVEDLYALLADVKASFPSIRGVAVGAILSNYQRLRVENVCSRLALLPIAFVWQRDQASLLQDMIDSHMHAVLVKVAAFGLHSRLLGKSLAELQHALHDAADRIGINVCGEGGEYESLVCGCPLFHGRRLDLESPSTAPHAPVRIINAGRDVAYLHIDAVGIAEADHACVDVSSHAASHAAQRFNSAFLPPLFPSALLDDDTSAPIRDDHATPAVISLSHDGSGCDFKSDAAACTRHILEAFSRQLQAHGALLRDIASVHLYLSDMSAFPAVNDAYAAYFGAHPPARAAVEVGPMVNADGRVPPLRMDAIAVIGGATRTALHVRTLSCWAPLCIGPYAQANIVSERIVFAAGQIPLHPDTMAMHDGSLRSQLQLALRNTARVLAAQQSALTCALCVLLYVTPAVPRDAWNDLRDDVCACVAGHPREVNHTASDLDVFTVGEGVACDCTAWDERAFPLGEAAHTTPAYMRDTSSRDEQDNDDDDGTEVHGRELGVTDAVIAIARLRAPVFIVPVASLPRGANVEVDATTVVTTLRSEDEDGRSLQSLRETCFESHDADLGDGLLASTTLHWISNVAAAVWTSISTLDVPDAATRIAAHVMLHVDHARQRAGLEWVHVSLTRVYVQAGVETWLPVQDRVQHMLRERCASAGVSLVPVSASPGMFANADRDICSVMQVHTLIMRAGRS